MKKKLIVSGAIVVFIAAIVILFMQNQTRKPDEDTLIFEGDNKQQIIVDVAIQEDEMLYVGSILLKDSKPTLENVLQTINDSEEGIKISINESGIIEAVDELKNTNEKKWKIYIDNKEVNQENIRKITVKKNNGITLMY